MEEKILVPFEMDCTVRFFTARGAGWRGLQAASPTPGHHAYAARQAHMWEALASHAASSFQYARA